jgi:hypothetical protein
VTGNPLLLNEQQTSNNNNSLQPTVYIKVYQTTGNDKHKYTSLLSIWTLSIVRISTNRKHKVSETGSVSILRRGGAPTLQKNHKLAFPQAMPEQKKFNHWKQGDYKHLTAGRVHGM